MSWMAWTVPTAVFFATIGAILIAMTAYEIKSPCIERKGFLPIETSRGDRLFIGLLSSAFVHLAYVGLTDMSLWIALAVCSVWLAVVMRWG